MNKYKKGFTPIELIIVIVVAGILAAILIPSIVMLKNKSKIRSEEMKTSKVNVSWLNYGFLELDKDSVIEPDYTKKSKLSSLEVGKTYLMVIDFDCLPSPEKEEDFSLKVNIKVDKSDCIDAYVEEASTAKTSSREIDVNGNPGKSITIEYRYTSETTEKHTETIVLRVETKSAANATVNIEFQGENCEIQGPYAGKTNTVSLNVIAPEMRTVTSEYPVCLK